MDQHTEPPTASRLISRMGLAWRLPLYRRYLYYIRHFRNWRDVIRAEQKGGDVPAYYLRDGIVIHLIDEETPFIFRDIWLHHVYTRYFGGPPPRTVVDVGANAGLFSLWAATHWADCQVYAYEPGPLASKVLRRNVEENHLGQIHVEEMAVGADCEPKKLFLGQVSGWSSLGYGTVSQETVSVPGIDLEGVLANAGGAKIDFAKIDCEGAEVSFLDGKLHSLRDHVSYVAMEYHETAGKRRDEWVAAFQEVGYTCQATGPDQSAAGILYACVR